MGKIIKNNKVRTAIGLSLAGLIAAGLVSTPPEDVKGLQGIVTVPMNGASDAADLAVSIAGALSGGDEDGGR